MRGVPKLSMAAICLPGGAIHIGKTHAEIENRLASRSEIPKPLRPGWYGFVDEDGRYLTREAALARAIRVGQVPRDTEPPLTCEHLW